LLHIKNINYNMLLLYWLERVDILHLNFYHYYIDHILSIRIEFVTG